MFIHVEGVCLNLPASARVKDVLKLWILWFTDRVCWHTADSSGKFQAGVLLSAVLALLECPNPNSPANSEAADQFLNSRAAFEAKARQATAEFAVR